MTAKGLILPFGISLESADEACFTFTVIFVQNNSDTGSVSGGTHKNTSHHQREYTCFELGFRGNQKCAQLSIPAQTIYELWY